MKKKRRFNWVFYGLVIYVGACVGLIGYASTLPMPDASSEHHQTAPSNKLIFRRIVKYVNKNEDELTDNYVKGNNYVYFIYEEDIGCSIIMYYGFCYSDNEDLMEYHRENLFRIEGGQYQHVDHSQDDSFDYAEDFFFQSIKGNWYYFECWLRL